MWLVLTAMRRPVTVLVAVLAILLGSYLAMQRMPADIFPEVEGQSGSNTNPETPLDYDRRAHE